MCSSDLSVSLIVETLLLCENNQYSQLHDEFFASVCVKVDSDALMSSGPAGAATHGTYPRNQSESLQAASPHSSAPIDLDALNTVISRFGEI